MTEKHFIIKLTEELTVGGTVGKINRNSNSTQFIDVELDGWKLNEGEELYIEFSHYNDDTELTTNVGPLHLLHNEELGRYVTLAPPELICVAGEWSYSIELRSDIGTEVGEDGEEKITYNSITSAIYALEVVDSIISATQDNGYAKETELLSAARVLTGAILVGHNAEELLAVADAARLSEKNAAASAQSAADSLAATEEAQAAAEQAKAEAVKLVQNTAEEVKTAAEVALTGAEQARDDAEQIAETMYNVVDAAAAEAQKGAEQAQAKAEKLVQQAEATVNGFVDYKNRTIKFTNALPVEGDDRILYAVVTDADSNLFDLYVWGNGEWRHLGGENIVANGQRTYARTLVGGLGWENNAQRLKIPALNDQLGEQQEVTIYPADESAAAYVLCGVTAEQSGNDLIFTCRNVPDVNLKVYINVGVSYETPSASGYYTSVQTDGKITDAINGIVDGAPDTYDTFKEIAEYISNDKSGTAELLSKVTATAEELVRQKALIEEEAAARESADIELTVGGSKVKGLDFTLNGTTLEITSRR